MTTSLETYELLDDVINSLAILRSFHRKEKDHVGVKLTTELIERVKIERESSLEKLNTDLKNFV